MPDITPKQIDALLVFIAGFDDDKASVEASGTFPAFLEALYANEWVVPFDWPEWQDEAQRLVKTPELIQTADLESIRKLFTTHARMDRFCEGHLAALIRTGHVSRLLHRLKLIRQEMDG